MAKKVGSKNEAKKANSPAFYVVELVNGSKNVAFHGDQWGPFASATDAVAHITQTASGGGFGLEPDFRYAVVEVHMTFKLKAVVEEVSYGE